MAMVPAMLLMTAATSTGPAFESSTPATVAASTAITAAIGTPATAAAIPSAASKRPLKTRAGIAAADARGLARKFSKWLQRSAGIIDARSSFAGKQNHPVVYERSGLTNFVSAVFLFAMRFVSPVRCVNFNVFAQGRDVQSVFVSCVGFCFSYRLRRADDFLNVIFMLFSGFVSAFVFLVNMFIVLLVLLVLRNFRSGALVGYFFV
jgi:hypothetical protein